MTSKERMLIAMQNKQADRVPVAPDISNMIPCRLTGKPFWDIYLYNDPPLWRAYLQALDYFKFDGWFTYGHVEFRTDSQIKTKRRIISKTEERIIEEIIDSTPAGDFRKEITYYRNDPPTQTIKPVKDIRQDFKKLKYYYPDVLGYDKTELEIMRRELGDRGVLGVLICYPGFQSWFGMVQGGVEFLTYAYYDHHGLIEEWRLMDDRRCEWEMKMILDAKPDFVLLGGSGSITLQSPDLFRELSLPTIKKLTRMAKQAGIPTMLHSCGKERVLVEMCVQETDLNCVNPLEVPPMGDCDLAEIKRLFGNNLSLMGNLHTTDIMLRGNPFEVQRAAMKCIADAAASGGFILSTGDQCGRDTPDENIFAMINSARIHGKY